MKMNTQCFRIGKWVAVVLVVAMAAGLYAEVREITPGYGLTRPRVIEMAQKNPAKLFKRSLNHFDATIRDYRGTLYRQERMFGKLGREQVINFKFKDDPHSVAMSWVHNAAKIDRLLYVEGQNDNKMLVRQDGLFALLGTARRDPHSKDVLVASLKPVTEFGFLKVLQSLADESASGPGKPKVTTKYVKTFYKYGRNVIEFEQTIDNPHDMKVSKRTMLFDIDLLIPIERMAYGPNGELLYKYVYRDMRFNTGLTSSDFTPQANGLK